MKAMIIGFFVIITCSTLTAQTVISSDTTIRRRIKINETFNLLFDFWPSPGMSWYMLDVHDSTVVKIISTDSKLMEGQFPIGGRYAQTFVFTGLKKGEVMLDYYWGRLWLKERLKKCTLIINID